jgi:hypothetical protein
VYNVRPDEAATANNDYFHVPLLDSVSVSVPVSTIFIAAIDASSMLAGWTEYFAGALGFH